MSGTPTRAHSMVRRPCARNATGYARSWESSETTPWTSPSHLTKARSSCRSSPSGNWVATRHRVFDKGKKLWNYTLEEMDHLMPDKAKKFKMRFGDSAMKLTYACVQEKLGAPTSGTTSSRFPSAHRSRWSRTSGRGRARSARGLARDRWRWAACLTRCASLTSQVWDSTCPTSSIRWRS